MNELRNDVSLSSANKWLYNYVSQYGKLAPMPLWEIVLAWILPVTFS